MTSSSRVKKYKELRETIKEEVGINRNVAPEEDTSLEDDEFLSFVNKGVEENKEETFEDTITEAKTFEQLSKESNAEIDKALKNVKTNVGKEEEYNTRLDILNRIRNPEKQVIKIDKMENMRTAQFAKGYFIKDTSDIEHNEIEQVEETPKQEKKKMSLMERLASMSPKEDVEKVEKALHEKEVKTTIKEEEIPEKPVEMEVPKVEKVILEEPIEASTETNNRDEKVVTILNYAIIALVVAFVIICIMIIYQLFF